MSRNEQIISNTTNALNFLFTKIILTWQFVVLLFIFIFSNKISGLFDAVDGIKGKGFEVTFKRIANETGLDDTTTAKIALLDFKALQVFLVKGGRYGNETKPDFGFLDSANLYNIIILLDSLHLLKYDSQKSMAESTPGHAWFVTYSTPEGEKLHSAINEAIYKTFGRKK